MSLNPMTAPDQKKRTGKKPAARTSAARRGAWDKSLAAAMQGNKLLAAVNHLAADGSVREQTQLFGIVLRISESEGILLELLGRRAGEEMVLPPDTSSVEEGVPGVYTLRSGEQVVDPDFIATFTLQSP
jgi:hypothetical protein